jgi:hypothetical protein
VDGVADPDGGTFVGSEQTDDTLGDEVRRGILAAGCITVTVLGLRI